MRVRVQLFLAMGLLALVACLKSPPMDEDRFWRIIAGTGTPIDPAETTESLRTTLQALSSEDLVAFNRIYHEKLRGADSWDLWAAGFIIGRGCSDDGFLEFRNFVIGHGRSFFEQAVQDPDSMAERLGPIRTEGQMRLPYLPDSDLVAGEIYRMRNKHAIPFERSGAKKRAGIRFSETRADLSQRCPKLWKRFGGDWIEAFERMGR